MAALQPGVQAPEFTLKSTDGTQLSLTAALSKGPVLLAFFKVSCPVCQYAFPFFERLHRGYQGKPVTVVGISQNNRSDTERFRKEFDISFPALLDDSAQYAVSNAYGLTNVPTVFLIQPDKTISASVVGWSRADMEAVNRQLAALVDAAQAPLFQPGESVADWKAG
jgi:peroxiredoxin